MLNIEKRIKTNATRLLEIQRLAGEKAGLEYIVDQVRDQVDTHEQRLAIAEAADANVPTFEVQNRLIHQALKALYGQAMKCSHSCCNFVADAKNKKKKKICGKAANVAVSTYKMALPPGFPPRTKLCETCGKNIKNKPKFRDAFELLAWQMLGPEEHDIIPGGDDGGDDDDDDGGDYDLDDNPPDDDGGPALQLEQDDPAVHIPLNVAAREPDLMEIDAE